MGSENMDGNKLHLGCFAKDLLRYTLKINGLKIKWWAKHLSSPLGDSRGVLVKQLKW